MTELKVNLKENSYNIQVGSGLLDDANKYFNLNRKVLIVTDSGVPAEYAKRLAKQCK